MSVTAASGVIGFGPQPEKGTLATNFYRHRAVQVDLSAQDDVRQGDLEVGGIPVPSFPYKGGPVVAGGFTLQPRLEDTLGWLLYAMLGKCTTTETGVGTGIYDHVFEMAADAANVPWLSARKAIGRRDGIANTDLGEIYKDCKVVGGTIVLPNDQPINMRVDMLGREFTLDHDPTAWSWVNTMEDWESIPVACATGGFIKVNSVELPVVGAQVGWVNQPLDLRAEKVYGDPYLDDVTVIARRLSVELTVKWNDPALYAQALTGSNVGTAWSAQPFTAPLDIKTVSSVNMTGEAEPYSLRIESDEIMLSPVGGLVLAAGAAVMQRFQGVALDATNYAKFTLRNLTSGYTWPPASS